MKPVFTQPLKSQTVPEEDSVTLECELSKPDQPVKWLKNGKELKPDKQRGIVRKVEGRRHSLTIPKTLLDDTAEYTVKCGEQETAAALTVEGKGAGPSPHQTPFASLDQSCVHFPSLALCLV